jgi:hypothetical protein
MSDPSVSEETGLHPPDLAPASDRPPPAGLPTPEPKCDWIVCDGCGRTFSTMDGRGMIAAIKGPCPDCGGTFELAGGAR